MKSIQRFTRFMPQQKSYTLKSIRKVQQQKHKANYLVVDQPCREEINEIFLYGNNKVYINAAQKNSFHSLQTTLALLEQIKPDCLLVDHFSFRQLKDILGLPHEQDLDKQILGKQKYTKFFNEWMPKQLRYYSLEDNNTYIYEVDEERKQIYLQPQLSAAYFACNEPKMHLIISQQDPIDSICWMAQHSLKVLQDAFYNSIEVIKNNTLEEGANPIDTTEVLLGQLRDAIQSEYRHLFKQQIQYQSEIIHKCGRLFNKTAVMTSQYLSSSLTKAIQKNKPKDEFPNEDHEDILERIVLSGYIVDYAMRLIAMKGGNPFENTIYQDVLGHKDVPQYLKLHEKYALKLHELQNFMIKAIMYKQQEQTFYKKYPDLVKEVYDRDQYDINICQMSQIQQGMMYRDLMKQQMDKLVQSRISQGINQKDVIQSLQFIQKDILTQKSVSDYMKLSLESNHLLGSPVKFPGNLKEKLLPYLQNVQADRISRQVAGLTFQPLTNNLSFTEIKEERPNDKKFSDSDDDTFDDDSSFSKKYIIGGNDRLNEMPEELRKLSFEQLKEKADSSERLSFEVDQDGNVDIKDAHKLFQMQDVEEIIKGGQPIDNASSDSD